MKKLICIFLLFYPLLTFSQSKVDYSIYIDTAHTSIQKIQYKHFKPISEPSINFGFKKFIVWVKVNFIEPKKNENLIFFSRTATNDSIITYLMYKSGRMDTRYFGTMVEQQNALYQNPMAIELNDSLTTIYIKTKSHSFLRDEYQIQPVRTYRSNSTASFLLYGVLAGVFLVMVLYNISLYAKLKESAYAYYSIYLLFMCFQLFYIEGIGNAFLWKDSILFNLYIEQFSIAMAVFGLSFYSIRVLKIKTHSRFIFYCIKIVGSGSLFFIVLLFFLSPFKSSQMAGILSLFCLIFVFIGAIIAVSKKEPYSKFYILGWAVFMITAIGRIFYNIGIISYNSALVFINYFGCLIEAAVFTWIISMLLKEKQEKNLLYQFKLIQYGEELDALKKSIEKTIESEEAVGLGIPPKINLNLSQLLTIALTEREQDVLKELSKGITYQQIGENLFISKNTVKTHVLNIYEKLDVKNRTEAINKAKDLKLS
jgi:two-component system, sensor histidine kinase LadS